MNYFPLCGRCKHEILSQFEGNPKCYLGQDCQIAIENNECKDYEEGLNYENT